MTQLFRIMLCDDSAIIRKLTKNALTSDGQFNVVCETCNGQEAVDQVAAVHPDAIVMDVEMPVMDGIDAVRELRKRGVTAPIIMFSSLTSRGAEATLDSIEAGASDFATKPTGVNNMEQAMVHIHRDLTPKLLHWIRRSSPGLSSPTTRRTRPVVAVTSPMPPTKSAQRFEGTSAIGIGVSTGGPQALTKLFSQLPATLPVPVLIVQHMPPVFTTLLAERLSNHQGRLVKEAVDGDEVQAGSILLAPGDYHLNVVRDKASVRVRLTQSAAVNSCRPAVDPLFKSLATCYGHRCLGIVLTGMGKDGTEGCRSLKAKGARVVVQDEATSVVWGMPGNVAREGLADLVLPIEKIGPEIQRTIEQGLQANAR